MFVGSSAAVDRRRLQHPKKSGIITPLGRRRLVLKIAAAVVAAYRIALGEPLKVPIVIKPAENRNWGEK